MIKFTGIDHGTQRELLGVGLSRRNCELLLSGRPIHIDGKKLGLPIDVIILGGETEEAMRQEIESGLSKPVPIIHHDPKLGTDKEHET